MRVCYKCELVERGRDLPIQLASIGMVREDGHELYLINQESLSNVVRHQWLSVNAVSELPIRFDDPYIFEWDREHEDYDNVVALDSIPQLILDFLVNGLELDPAELWAWHGAYDHVALCQLFGAMGELPAGMPAFTHDLQQLHEEYPQVVLPPQPIRQHNAMHEARWVLEAIRRIDEVRNLPVLGNEVEAEVIDES